MRVLVMAGALLLAAPAWAQPVLDGKASVDEDTGSFVATYLDNMHMPDKGASAFRSIISYVVTRGLKPEDQDLFVELASGKPVVVTAPDRTVNVPAVTGEALEMVTLFLAPPNLNTLWQTPGKPIVQLVEMSRWGKPAKERIVGFMSNKLYAAWSQSRSGSGYNPWVSEFLAVGKAIDSIENTTTQLQAKQLLKAAMESVLVKSKADGRDGPPSYLYGSTFFGVGDPASPP